MESTEKNGTPSIDNLSAGSPSAGRGATSGKASRGYVYAVTLTASTGGFLFGFDLSIISGAVVFLREEFHLTQAMFGLANGSAILGCIVGPLLGLRLADGRGRRTTLAVAAACFMISAVGSALAYGMIDFVIWRALGGIGVGLAMATSPMYIAELAPAGLRGRLITVNQLAIVVGINMAIVVASFLSFGGHWRWMFAAEIVPIAALMVGLLFAPRSPRWLASKGRNDEAMRVLTKVNGRDAAGNVLDEIQAELHQQTGTFRDLLMPRIRLALMIGVVLMIFQQINGVNMILLYSASFICTQVFPVITEWFEAEFGNPGGAYWIFSAICFCCVLFCWRAIPETKGLTLEQISQFWLRHRAGTGEGAAAGAGRDGFETASNREAR